MFGKNLIINIKKRGVYIDNLYFILFVEYFNVYYKTRFFCFANRREHPNSIKEDVNINDELSLFLNTFCIASSHNGSPFTLTI